jgi:hypothetical protein
MTDPGHPGQLADTLTAAEARLQALWRSGQDRGGLHDALAWREGP